MNRITMLIPLLFLMASTACKETEFSSEAPAKPTTNAKKNAGNTENNVDQKNGENLGKDGEDGDDSEQEDAIDLVEAKCTEKGGSWNGEECVVCEASEIWDADKQACIGGNSDSGKTVKKDNSELIKNLIPLITTIATNIPKNPKNPNDPFDPNKPKNPNNPNDPICECP